MGASHTFKLAEYSATDVGRREHGLMHVCTLYSQQAKKNKFLKGIHYYIISVVSVIHRKQSYPSTKSSKFKLFKFITLTLLFLFVCFFLHILVQSLFLLH